MEFTTSDGRVVPEYVIRYEFSRILKRIEQNGGAFVTDWEIEFLEWYLNKEIEYEEKDYIKLHENITENELKQLEQLRDYLEL